MPSACVYRGAAITGDGLTYGRRQTSIDEQSKRRHLDIAQSARSAERARRGGVGSPGRALHAAGLSLVPRPAAAGAGFAGRHSGGVQSGFAEHRPLPPRPAGRHVPRLVADDLAEQVNDCFRKKGNEATAAGGTEAHATFQQIADGSLESDSGIKSDQDSPEATEKQLLFRRALELVQRDFEERTWKAFWKVVVDGMTPKDAGEELDMKPGTVRVAKSRVLARLRQEFGDLMCRCCTTLRVVFRARTTRRVVQH